MNKSVRIRDIGITALHEPGRDPAASPQPPWRLHALLAAPHRLAFAAGVLVLGVASLWWAFVQSLRAAGVSPPWTLPPATAHGVLMTFGFMPMFFVGFLFTAGPKWLGLASVDARVLRAALLIKGVGWILFLVGVHAASWMPTTGLAAAGLAVATWGWASVAWRFARMVAASPVADRVHAKVVLVALVIGVAGLATAALAVALERPDVVRAATMVGLWGFVGIVYVCVSHRMIPFFTAAALPMLDAWRPMWLLAVFVGVLGFEAALALAEPWAGPASRGIHVLQLAVESAAALLFLALSLRWGLVQSLRIRLLAMLHVGFTWLGVALALSALSHALALVSGGERTLGLAPLHAYTMGFFGSTLVAMVTRVSAGHSGRALAADDFVWRLFWWLQAGVVLRVVTGAAVAWGGGESLPALTAAAWVWAAVLVAWGLRHLGWYGRPRIDGKPG
jgi:uncharacterized protein involved in response to NO